MTKSKAVAKMQTPSQEVHMLYGMLTTEIHITGYTFERACSHLLWLLTDDRWKQCGTFSDVQEFLDGIRLDQFRAVVEVRKQIAAKIKALQPKVSNRKIAKVLGVGETTIRRDAAPSGAGDAQKVNQNKGAKDAAAPNGAPGLTGAEAARVVARAERVAGQQDKVNDRVAKVAFDANALGKFSADPPWDDEFGKSDRSIENHYPTMRQADILALPVADIAHSSAMLFLWATPSMIEMALATAKAWSFEYRTQLIWVKPSIGLGKYVRQRHEILLICRRGDHPAPAPELLPNSVIEAPRGVHSAKPDVFLETIERMYPGAAKIELFRRGAPRDGWAAWGAESQTGEAAE
jgi:N6-adenosine-specific RNA methylase IME4